MELVLGHKRSNFLIFLFSVAFSLAVGEMLLRLIWLPKQPTPTRLACEHDPILGWRKISNASFTIKTSEYQVKEVLNPKGLRGPEYPYGRIPSTFRILLLGDSFVEGYSVNEANLFSNFLERNFPSGGDNLQSEVINMGTGGYSTDQEYLTYLVEGRKYNPDMVVLFYYHNDLLYNTKDLYDGYSKPYFIQSPDGLLLRNVPVPRVIRFNPFHKSLERLALFRLVKIAKSKLTQMITKNKEQQESELDCFLKNPPMWVERGWTITELILRNLNSMVINNGAKLLVIYIPAIFEFDSATLKNQGFSKLEDFIPEKVSSRLKKICDNNMVKFFDLGDEFRKKKGSEAIYYPKDGHWNLKGHQLVAQSLSRIIAEVLSENECAQVRPN